MVYHLQIDGSNKKINQIIEIMLRFFVYAFEDPLYCSKVLLQIQSIFNNTLSLTIGKIPNKITYRFFPWRLLNLLAFFPISNIYITCINATDTILFGLANQKAHYNRKHQLMFITVGNWAKFCLYKDYSIPSSIKITKKLTQ